jgi:eukaryotic-like serine/threonine-protein kinase
MNRLSDRYEVLGSLASGGMASVLYGRLKAPTGFAREVAIKRLHPHFACDPEFVAMFIDEAHICARLSHANIVSALDVIETSPDLCLVMEYVHGAGLDVLEHAARSRGQAVPIPIAVSLLIDVLHGLHAAHEACDDQGSPLGIVHRDVSPPNVLVGQDGVARVLDFGIAKAVSKLRTTPHGELKGKFAYMAPELLSGAPCDRRLDVYAAAVVLWELLAGRSLFGGQPSASIIRDVLERAIPAPSSERAALTPALDAIVLQGLAREPSDRFASAGEFAIALERACEVASQSEVSAWVKSLVGELLEQRAAELRRLGRATPDSRLTPIAKAEDWSVSEPQSLPEQTTTDARLPSAMSLVEKRAPAKRAAWWVRWCAVLVLGGVLRADASPERDAPPTRAVEPIAQTHAREPTVAALNVQRAAPHSAAVSMSAVAELDRPRQLPAKQPLATPRSPAETRSSRAETRSSTAIRAALRPLAATPEPRRAISPAASPSAVASDRAPADDCRRAFELETVDGVVIKKFKPNCLK